MSNKCNKTAHVDKPYEIYRSHIMPGWEWRVLRKYQSPDNEAKNELAIWFCAVKSPLTYGSWEYGDTYKRDILEVAHAYRVCPKCDGVLEGWPALSRVDNVTEICSNCGTNEAAEAFGRHQGGKA